MGLIEFQLECPECVRPEALKRIDFVTFDGRVIPSDVSLHENRLSCQRALRDSSKARVLFPIDDSEPIVLQTGSLREDGGEYCLEIELARGELTRLRNFYSLWTGAGLKPNAALVNLMARSHVAFRKAIFGEERRASVLESIRLTHEAIRILVDLYTTQRVTFRQQRTQRFPMFIGCRITEPPIHEEAFCQAFNSVMVKTRWSDLEPRDGEYKWDKLDALVDWAVANRMTAIGGPLLDLSSDCFPEWMRPWKGDIVNLQSFTSDFVETVVSRYVGRIRHWEVVCGPNRGGANELTEQQRLNLLLHTISAAQHVDEQIQISLRIVQPWGEYLNETDNRLPPVQFVDTIRRSGARLSEVNLDIRFSTEPLSSQHRDMLNMSQLLDHWSLLQMPINVMAALPQPLTEMSPHARTAWQLQKMEDLFLMCLSKERVTGFYCLNWSDQTVLDEPLVDENQSMHPVVSNFSALERAHWPH